MGRFTRNARQVPDGWQVVRLGDVAEFVNGRAFRPEEWGTCGLPIVRIQNLTSPEAPYNFFNGEVDNKHLIDNGDIVISWSASLEARTWKRGLAALNQHIFKVIDDPSIAGRRFLFHLLQLTMIFLRQQVHGTTMQHITKGNFDSTSILLPPLTEQRAVATVLDSIDEAIERTEAIIAATDRLRDALLHELLTRGVPGWHSEWKDAPGIGTIPADWDVVRLGDVLKSTTYGTNASLDETGGVPVLRMKNLQDGEIHLYDLKRADLADKELSGLNLIPGDILFNRTNSLDLVGKVAIVRDLPQPISFASYLVRLRVNCDRANPFWLSALLCSRSCQSRIRRFATPGVSQANINPTSLKSLKIPLAPLPEQEIIAGVLDSIDTAFKQARNETNALSFLKASAADVLLTGQLTVKIGGSIVNVS